MFNNITINNFRGIKTLTIEDFGRVNLLVGENNIGKTTVLEAIYIATNINNPSLILQTNAIRGLHLHDKNTFYNNILSLPIEISTSYEGNELSTTIKPIFATILSTEPKEEITDTYVAGFSFQVQYGEKKDIFLTSLEPNERKITAPIVDAAIQIPIISGSYINLSQYIRNDDFIEKFQKAAKLGNLGFIINALQIIEPTITRIAIIDNNINCMLGNIERYIPLNIMGDGIANFVCTIFVYLSCCTNGIVCLDTIGMNLHYSVMVNIWKAILHTAKANNIQVFATTHSHECIEALNEAYKEIWKDKEPDQIRLYRVQKSIYGPYMNAVKYDAENISANLLRHWEVR